MARPAGSIGKVVVEGPLALYAEAYRDELVRRGYKPRTSVHQLRQVAQLSRWLDAQGLSAASLTRERVERFFERQRAVGATAYCSLPGLLALLDVLRELGVAKPSRAAAPGVTRPEDVIVASFERYLREERGLVTETRAHYLASARRFMQRLPGAGVPAGLTAGQVTQAVLAESTTRPAAARYFVVGLRSFLRFCFLEGLTGSDLSSAALTVKARRSSGLPKTVSRAQVRALLDSCNRRQAVGRRDYAVILVLLRLGLRAGEVASLTLEGIDWRQAEMVVRGKGRRADRVPLPADVGAAIAAYLRRGRPVCHRREVFLRALAPVSPLGRGGCLRSCAGPATERRSRRSGRTACAIRQPAKWSQPGFRWPTSARCCAMPARPPPRSMRGWISSRCASWAGPGPRRSSERLGDPRR